ncbi:hypothetical protein [Haladaptatus sp. T7]|uniref:hypothetical protein n=1 Tax=Haladaptatus sp. T7 TaxID=2029368 RepID=UPI0021A25451|nr:hypothetical protein [Haladaptatus sp. T7]GKZ13533.1 hypothetical protein HAL_14140 [Haladaptatus sp. T7]
MASAAEHSTPDEIISSSKVVEETDEYTIRRTETEGGIVYTRFNKIKGTVEVLPDYGTEASASTFSQERVGTSATTSGVKVIETSTPYYIEIENQCHIKRCGSGYDHIISGTSFRFVGWANTIANAVLASAVLSTLTERLPALAVSAIKNHETVANAFVSLFAGEVANNSYSFAVYDYDLGGFGIYSPAIGGGFANVWKARKNALIPHPALLGAGMKDTHLGSNC